MEVNVENSLCVKTGYLSDLHCFTLLAFDPPTKMCG